LSKKLIHKELLAPISAITSFIVCSVVADLFNIHLQDKSMRKFPKTLLASSFCMIMSISSHGDPGAGAPDIESLMSPEQYKASGLQKLNVEEREALYQWLRHYAGKTEVQKNLIPSENLPSASTTAVAVQPAVKKQTKARPAEPVSEEPLKPAAQPTTATVAVASPPVSEPEAGSAETADPSTAASDENFGFPEQPVESKEAAYGLNATVLEPFRGWSGKTIFYLDNGQVWKQRSSGRHTYGGDDNRVLISKNRLGLYEMRLVAADRAVGVKRVK
jgi:hypothetical protein